MSIIYEIILCIFRQHAVKSFILRSNILSILFSEIFGIFSSVNVRDRVSHPDKTAGKTLVFAT